MLGVTLWLVVAIGLLATLFLDAAAAFGHATVRAAADHAIDAATHDAVADYQNRLASALARDPAPPPSGVSADGTASRYAGAIASIERPLQRTYPSPADRLAAGTAFTLAYEIEPTTIVAPGCSLATAQTGPDAVGWLQCNGFVAESRMSLRVVVRVLDAGGGALLARREHFVTLRLFGEPPYSAVVGRKDAAAADPVRADALAPPAHEGDLAAEPVDGAPPASPWPAGGELIHVRYECRDGAGSCANAAPPDPDEALRAGARWSNGNRPPP